MATTLPRGTSWGDMAERRDKFGRYTCRPTDTVLNRFMSNVSPEPMSGCWLWTGALHSRFGYGAFKWGNRASRVETSHRVAYKLFIGDIERGKVIRHACNNPSCVNPNHLLQGTYKENANDKIAAGTLIFGKNHYQAKVSDSIVAAMRSAPKRAIGVAIGIANGLSRQAAHDIMSFRTWKHVELAG